MKFRVEVVFLREDGAEQRRAVMELERRELAMATLGMSLEDGKALLEGVQEFVATCQVAEDLILRRPCPLCSRRRTTKGAGMLLVKTAFGKLRLPNPRWHRCPCSSVGPRTLRPVASWLRGRASPELLYIETKWASLVPYATVAELLRDVLPLGEGNHHETIRRHLYASAERLEAELGEERTSLVEGTDDDWEQLPSPDGPMTVGIDGGYVRAAHKRGFFEVIAGKSVVAFRRHGDDRPSAKCFGFVQTYDEKPRRRLWELMKSQGMQENQEVVFFSDGGEDVRRLQAYLHPFSEHLIDWFHITMRVTVLRQQAKSVRPERPELADEVTAVLETTKHLLWHGNAERALEELVDLLFAVEEFRQLSTPGRKLVEDLQDFETYIRNNQDFIPNFGERRRQGETISTAFVESTVNQVVSKRFVKKQQMQWTLRGAHLLLQTRTRVINDELDDAFRRWYPHFREAA